ncbi:MAG: hypothetical protein HOP17_15225, partial [Acidobacteria bacterium]|nr:hypothetical protein [Acidobacteriota bacterium]
MSYSITPEPAEAQNTRVDAAKLEQLVNARQAEQSLPLAMLAGLGSSLIAAVIWAAISYATNFQIGFMAVGVGFLVGYAVN